jgi:hypothetical protein
MPVVEEESLQILGTVSSILIQPDTGKVEAFGVTVRGFLHATELVLSTIDIVHWGSRVAVSHAEVLAPIDDHIRLRALLEEQRPVLGQTIRTDTDRILGRCDDVQFDTSSFHIEWLFPRRWWRWGLPIASSQIIEVKRTGIVVREPSEPQAEKEVPGVAILPQLPEAA